MSREILLEMEKAGLQIASGTYAIVQVSKLQVSLDVPHSDGGAAKSLS